MKILIVAANRERSPFPVAPLGALSIVAAARRAGHEADLLDLMFLPSPAGALARALRHTRYDVLGFSIRNLDNCFYISPKSYADEVMQFIEVARRHAPRIPLILGGSGFSMAPREWLRRTGADCGIVGEGEAAFTDLLSRYAQNQSPHGIPGVLNGNNSNDIIYDNRIDSIGNNLPALGLNDLAPPHHAKCRYARYLARGGFVGIQTKRGCPFECIYCTYPRLEGSCYRLRDPELVANEIEAVHRDQAARFFFFTDSVFNSPPEHALAVCEALIRRRSPVRWMAFCSPLGLDRAMAGAMARAGCIGVELGLDAASEKMLAVHRKPFGQSEIRASFEALRIASIPFSAHLLFGAPGETWRDIDDAQAFLDGCPAPNAIFASLGLRIYQGTQLERLARAEGALTATGELFDPVYYLSPELGAEAPRELDRVARRRPEWSTPVDWGKGSIRLVQQLLNRLGVRPQWLNIRNYGRYMRR